MKTKLNLLIPLILMVALLLAACAQQEAEPAQQDEIVIGILEDFSGVTAGILSLAVEGEKDAMRYINEELGGILGHPIDAIIIDHKVDAALMLSGWDRLKAEGVPVVMAFLGGLPAMEALCQKDGIPIVGGVTSIDQGYPKGPSYFFGQQPHGPGLVIATCDEIEKDWSKKNGQGTPKVASSFISLGSYKGMLTKATKMEMEKRGWDYIINYTTMSPADVTTQVLQAKEFEADYLFLLLTETGAIVWYKDLERQKFHPPIYGINALGSQEVWNAVGKFVLGTTCYQYNPQWTDTDSQFISKLHELNAKWYPDVTHRGGYYVRGSAGLLVTAEALERAIEKVGYENLDGEAMKEALETIRDFHPMDAGVGWTWTPTDRHGLNSLKWYAWNEDGTLVPASDWTDLAPLPEEQRNAEFWWK